MRTENLENVLELAKIGSISATAKKLWIGPTSLSATLRSVESELDTVIFIRTAKGIQLTEDGERIIPQIEKVVEEYRKLLKITQSTNDTRTHCVFSSYPAISPLIGSFLAQRMDQNPIYHIDVKNVLSYKLLSALADGTVDIGLALIQEQDMPQFAEEAKENNISLEILAEDKQCIAIRYNSDIISGDEVNCIEDLPQLRACSATFFPLFSGSYNNINSEHFSHCFTFEDMDSVKRAIATTDTVTVLPTKVFYDSFYIKEKMIRLIKLKDSKYNVFNVLAYPSKRTQPQIIEAVAAATKRFFDTVK